MNLFAISAFSLFLGTEKFWLMDLRTVQCKNIFTYSKFTKSGRAVYFVTQVVCYETLEIKPAVVQNKFYFSYRTENSVHQTIAETKFCSFVCQK